MVIGEGVFAVAIARNCVDEPFSFPYSFLSYSGMTLTIRLFFFHRCVPLVLLRLKTRYVSCTQSAIFLWGVLRPDGSFYLRYPDGDIVFGRNAP